MTTVGPPDLRAFLEQLRRDGDLRVIEEEVDPKLELPEIHRRVIAVGGPALLFQRPRGAAFPLVTNLFGTRGRVERAFGRRPQELVAELARLPHELMPPSLGRLWQRRGTLRELASIGFRHRRRGPISEVAEESPRLSRLPATTSWPEDGGPFLTLPLVHTQHPETGIANLGIYRMQVYDDAHTGMHMQIAKGGGFHLSVAERAGHDLKTQVYLGGPPALLLAAVAPLPENVPELLLASLVLGRRLDLVRDSRAHFPLPAAAEVALIGEVVAGTRRAEGPFGDHYGYYSLVHDYPVFRCRRMLRRRDPIVPATVVGKPRQEDFYIGDYLQELLSPLFPLVMPGVRALWSYGETGYHSLAAAVVEERYRREAMVSAFRILGEGQLALTKFLIVTDRAVDLSDFRATLEHVLARFDPALDLFVFANLSMDSLDYAGPRRNEGGKGVMLGIGESRRELPRELPSALSGARESAVFCGGCLVVSGPSFVEDQRWPERLAALPSLASWPLVVVVDDAAVATRSTARFLWTAFTRFDPGQDLHARASVGAGNHLAFAAPVVLDARMKPSYPRELACDPETARVVTQRWRQYFPAGLAMGDSDVAHLDR